MTDYLATPRMMADKLRPLILEETHRNDKTVELPLGTATTIYQHLLRLAELDEELTGGDYSDAFYELAAMMGLTAQPRSPKEVWEQQMRPRLAAMFARTKELTP